MVRRMSERHQVVGVLAAGDARLVVGLHRKRNIAASTPGQA